MDVKIGWPGKVHDSRVLVNSSFYQRCNSGTVFPNWCSSTEGVEVRLEIQRTLFCRGLSSHTWRMQAQPIRNVTSTIDKVEHEW